MYDGPHADGQSLQRDLVGLLMLLMLIGFLVFLGIQVWPDVKQLASNQGHCTQAK